MTYGYPAYPASYSNDAYELDRNADAYDDGWDDVMWADVDWYRYDWDDYYANGVDDADYHLWKKRLMIKHAYAYWG